MNRLQQFQKRIIVAAVALGITGLLAPGDALARSPRLKQASLDLQTLEVTFTLTGLGAEEGLTVAVTADGVFPITCTNNGDQVVEAQADELSGVETIEPDEVDRSGRFTGEVMLAAENGCPNDKNWTATVDVNDPDFDPGQLIFVISVPNQQPITLSCDLDDSGQCT